MVKDILKEYPRTIKLYSWRTGVVETQFPNEYWMAFSQQLELKLQAYKGLSVPDVANSPLAIRIKNIEQERDNAKQQLAETKKKLLQAQLSGGTSTALVGTQEIIDWEKVHADFKDNVQLVKKWKTTNPDDTLLRAEDWISRGFHSDWYSLAKWLKAKPCSPADWDGKDTGARKTLTDEYEVLDTVDNTNRYNWADITAGFVKADRDNWETLAKFNFVETWQWIVEAGMSKDDYGFCQWLKEVKSPAAGVGTGYDDPDWVMAHANIGTLRAEYNTYVITNKIGIFKVKPTDFTATDLVANRKIEFKVNAGSIVIDKMSIPQRNRLNVVGLAGVDTIHLLYNLDHTHTGTPEEIAYNQLKPVLTNERKNKEWTISLTDADKITIATTTMSIPFGSFDDVEVIGWSSKPVNLALQTKINALKTGVKGRLAMFSLAENDFNVSGKERKHFDDTSVPTRPKWEEFVNQIIYDLPKGTDADRADWNYSDVEEIMWSAMADFAVDFYACKGAFNGRTKVANDKDNLQRYIYACRSQIEINTYENRKTDIESIGATTKEKPDNYSKVLGEIKTFFSTKRSLADIRAKGEALKAKYVDPMAGIDLNGKDEATKLALPKDVSASAEINGAEDFQKTITFATSTGATKTVVKNFKSNKDRYSKYIPLDTQGGGNCYLHSLNIHLTGLNNGQLITQLRTAVCLGVMANKTWIPDPTSGGTVAEDGLAETIKNYLTNRNVQGQNCRLAYEGDYIAGDDMAWFSELLERPLVLVYKTDGEKVAGYASGKYAITSSWTATKGKNYAHKKPWHVYHIGTAHYEAFVRPANHEEILLGLKPNKIEYVDPTNVDGGGKRAIKFTITKGDLKSLEHSVDHDTAINGYDLANQEEFILDFSTKDDFTNERWANIQSMLNKSGTVDADKDKNTSIDKSNRDFVLEVWDYKKIDKTAELKVKPEDFEIEITK